MRTCYLRFHFIFKWVILNSELALSNPTQCVYCCKTFCSEVGGHNKYSTYFKIFQIKSFWNANNAFPSFNDVVQRYFLEFLKLFFPTACGNKKIAVCYKTQNTHTSWMVGNEPHLGGQRNIMVCPSLNCCWVNKQRRSFLKNAGGWWAGVEHF